MDSTATHDTSRKWAVLSAVGVGTFMSALDASIVNATLPRLQSALHASVAGIEWVVTVYLLVVSGLLLIVGRLGDMRGHKDVYVAGFLGFVLSSALCGLSSSVGWLVAFRAVQALSAAALFANAPAILTASFPPSERGRALGLQATMTYLGLSVGPPLGQLLASRLGWQAIFYVNLPVGALGFWLSQRNIARDRPAGAPPRFDVLGAGLFFVGLLAVLLALNQGHAWGWAAPATLGLLAGGGAVLAAFVVVERRRAEPVLDLSLFRSRVFAGATGSAMVSYVAQFAVLFLLPFYLQWRGYGAEATGGILMAQPVTMMVTAPIAGTLSDRLGTRGPVVIGLGLLAAGIMLLCLLGPSTPTAVLVVGMAVAGLGFGAFVAPNNSRLLGAAPPHRRGIASGVLAAARNVGMVLGVGLGGAVYTTVLARLGDGAVAEGVSLAFRIVVVILAVTALTSWLEGRAPDEKRSPARHQAGAPPPRSPAQD
jgi:EmrB/QacA subfamily drug resistance transporter